MWWKDSTWWSVSNLAFRKSKTLSQSQLHSFTQHCIQLWVVFVFFMCQTVLRLLFYFIFCFLAALTDVVIVFLSLSPSSSIYFLPNLFLFCLLYIFIIYFILAASFPPYASVSLLSFPAVFELFSPDSSSSFLPASALPSLNVSFSFPQICMVKGKINSFGSPHISWLLSYTTLPQVRAGRHWDIKNNNHLSSPWQCAPASGWGRRTLTAWEECQRRSWGWQSAAVPWRLQPHPYEMVVASTSMLAVLCFNALKAWM